MKHFFQKSAELLLIILAMLFLAMLFVYLSWGIGYVASEVNRAVNTKQGQGAPTGFDLQNTQNVDFRGLVKPQQ